MRVSIPLERVLQERIRVTESGCWEWLRARDASGYGRWVIDGREWKAHRKAYEVHVGPIPAGYEIDHLCKNPSCVNPAHLEAVTRRTNVERSDGPSAVNARKTHCAKGHEFTPENTHVRKNGHRACRACRAAQRKKWREANPERAQELARQASRKWREKNPAKTREAARVREAAKRATPEGRAAYNEYMREYHRQARAAKRAAG